MFRDDAKHKRAVMACLVRAVSLLESDRQWKSEGSEAQAPQWWKTFHFELCEPFKEEDDNTQKLKVEDDNTQKPIIGAIFEFMFPKTHNHLDKAPRFVIALRGTMLKMATCFSDLGSDWDILTNNLHQSRRYEKVLSIAMNKVQSAGVRKVLDLGMNLSHSHSTAF